MMTVSLTSKVVLLLLALALPSLLLLLEKVEGFSCNGRQAREPTRNHHGGVRRLSLFQAAKVTSSTSTTRLYNTGGWGIGPQREMKPEEFANGRGGSASNFRRAASFEGYQLRDRGEFMRQVAQDKDSFQQGALEELLGVAASAGIAVKDPKERLNKFDASGMELEDDDVLLDDGLDVSVQWDDNDTPAATVAQKSVADASKNTDSSITRLDEDTGALGVW